MKNVVAKTVCALWFFKQRSQLNRTNFLQRNSIFGWGFGHFLIFVWFCYVCLLFLRVLLTAYMLDDKPTVMVLNFKQVYSAFSDLF